MAKTRAPASQPSKAAKAAQFLRRRLVELMGDPTMAETVDAVATLLDHVTRLEQGISISHGYLKALPDPSTFAILDVDPASALPKRRI